MREDPRGQAVATGRHILFATNDRGRPAAGCVGTTPANGAVQFAGAIAPAPADRGGIVAGAVARAAGDGRDVARDVVVIAAADHGAPGIAGGAADDVRVAAGDGRVVGITQDAVVHAAADG